MPLSPFDLDLYLKCHSEALLEGVEMHQDKDEIHIEQTEGERPRLLEMYEGSSIVRTSKRMLEKQANTLYVDVQMHYFHPSPLLQRMTSRSYLHRLHINMYEKKHVHPLSPMESVGNMEIVIGDYFQLSNNVSRESSMFHQWMQGLGMNNTFGINLTFFALPDGLPPLQGDTPSWNILRPDHISQVVDVASKAAYSQTSQLKQKEQVAESKRCSWDIA
ncbi:hypothetical protein SELMODRAFT_411655 [Selaginella moellendorffii]|uniref:Uncharacterized protein n=1 Tax=Selaginella moellendorffii TaxID=88036 RepID=D8RIL9_SELML|nr:hypothetical protein SELMODRAFT_411655 [Selaginella moellendorffii]